VCYRQKATWCKRRRDMEERRQGESSPVQRTICGLEYDLELPLSWRSARNVACPANWSGRIIEHAGSLGQWLLAPLHCPPFPAQSGICVWVEPCLAVVAHIVPDVGSRLPAQASYQSQKSVACMSHQSCGNFCHICSAYGTSVLLPLLLLWPPLASQRSPLLDTQ
jgi:hypothetical protein